MIWRPSRCGGLERGLDPNSSEGALAAQPLLLHRDERCPHKSALNFARWAGSGIAALCAASPLSSLSLCLLQLTAKHPASDACIAAAAICQSCCGSGGGSGSGGAPVLSSRSSQEPSARLQASACGA